METWGIIILDKQDYKYIEMAWWCFMEEEGRGRVCVLAGSALQTRCSETQSCRNSNGK